MSRPIFSPVTAIDVGVSLDPPPAVQYAGHRTLTPGQRIIDGRVFYSAAWLDQATGAFSEAPAWKCRGDSGREHSAVADLSPRSAGPAAASAPGVGG